MNKVSQNPQLANPRPKVGLGLGLAKFMVLGYFIRFRVLEFAGF